MRENVDTRHVSTATNGYGCISLISGFSYTSQPIVPINCIETIPAKIKGNKIFIVFDKETKIHRLQIFLFYMFLLKISSFHSF